MTITALLAFMVLSQIALAAYLLYSFADMRRYLDASLTQLEQRLTGASAAPVRKRAAGEN